MAVVESVNIGIIRDYGDFRSAMDKHSVNSIEIGFTGIVGDMLSDIIHHGGEFKAVFANAVSNYAAFNKFASRELKFGQMGENLSITILDEKSVCIGDIHQIGNALLQVSEPRKPCVKLSKIIARGMTKFIFENGLSGWYYQVLEPGTVCPGDSVKVVHKDTNQLSVMELNMLFFAPKDNINLLQKLERVHIRDEWRDSITARLKGVYDNSYMDKL